MASVLKCLLFFCFRQRYAKRNNNGYTNIATIGNGITHPIFAIELANTVLHENLALISQNVLVSGTKLL